VSPVQPTKLPHDPPSPLPFYAPASPSQLIFTFAANTSYCPLYLFNHYLFFIPSPPLLSVSHPLVQPKTPPELPIAIPMMPNPVDHCATSRNDPVSPPQITPKLPPEQPQQVMHFNDFPALSTLDVFPCAFNLHYCSRHHLQPGPFYHPCPYIPLL